MSAHIIILNLLIQWACYDNNKKALLCGKKILSLVTQLPTNLLSIYSEKQQRQSKEQKRGSNFQSGEIFWQKKLIKSAKIKEKKELQSMLSKCFRWSNRICRQFRIKVQSNCKAYGQRSFHHRRIIWKSFFSFKKILALKTFLVFLFHQQNARKRANFMQHCN